MRPKTAELPHPLRYGYTTGAYPGQSDGVVMQVCQREQRALISLDLDCSDIRRYPPENHSGIIVLRPDDQGTNAVLRLMRRILPLLAGEPLVGRWIVDEH